MGLTTFSAAAIASFSLSLRGRSRPSSWEVAVGEAEAVSVMLPGSSLSLARRKMCRESEDWATVPGALSPRTLGSASTDSRQASR